MAAEAVKADTLHLAHIASLEEGRLIKRTHQLFDTLSQLSIVQRGDRSSLDKLFADLLKQNPQYAMLGAATPGGMIFSSSVPLKAPVDIKDRVWFQEAIKTLDFVVGDYQVGKISGKPSLHFGCPVFDRKGRLKVVLFAALDLTWLTELIAGITLSEGSVVRINDRNGTILARYPDPENWVGKPLPQAGLLKEMLSQGEGIAEFPSFDGIPSLYAFAPLGDRHASAFLSIRVTKKAAFASTDRIFKRNLLMLGIVAVVAIAAAWFLGDLLIMRRIKSLLAVTKRLASGDLEARAGPFYGSGELRQLAEAFDQMAEALQRREDERKKAEQALRESESRYREMFESLEDVYYQTDSEGIVRVVSPSIYRFAGWKAEEIVGKPVTNVYAHPENRKKLLFLLAEKGFVRDYEVLLKKKDGTILPVSAAAHLLFDEQGRPSGIGGMLRDITERKQSEQKMVRLQDQLQQAQKMEAIGTLAGGIAHDFNNILTAILGFAEFADSEMEEGSRAKRNLEQSIRAAYRAKDLVQQILTFSRQTKQERKPMNLKPIVKEGLKFLRASLPATVEIRQEIEEDLGLIEADPTQIHQVLMNLCTNAAHAMDEKGGQLKVSLSNADLNASSADHPEGIEPGPYVRLQVSDTGHGMSPEIMRRIFDPYFTTKAPDKGTGLGLSVVHGIVKSCGGEIAVSSEVGKGSTFDIYLPRIKTVDGPLEVHKAEPLPLGNRERILFVDDEKPIVDLSREILGYLGYEVTTRTSSIEALEYFKKQPDRFDAVITDMTMPNMTGDKLAEELLKIRPDIPIILCTGFSEHISQEKSKAIGIRELVMKPMAMKEMAKTMRRVLGPQGDVPTAI